MRRLLAFLAQMFPRFAPAVKWEDGVIDRDLKYAIIYADVVRRIQAVRPDAIQAPTMRVTVRLYDAMPHPYEGNWGKVLSPNTIAGDTGGTLCLKNGYAGDDTVMHEMAHCVTGIPDHPAWLYKNDPMMTLNV